MTRHTIGLVLGTLLFATARAQSIYFIGNSLTNDAITAGTGIQQIAYYHGTPITTGYYIRSNSSLQTIWEQPRDQYTYTTHGLLTEALPNNHWDAISLQPFARQNSTFQSDLATIANIISLAKQNPSNTNTIFYIYETWSEQALWPYSTNWDAPSDLTQTVQRRQYMRELVKQLRQENPSTIIRTVPTAEVFYNIDQDIQHYNTLTALTDLWKDTIHLNNIGRYVASVSMLSVIMNTNTNEYYPSSLYTPIDPTLVQQLNEVTWNTIINTKYTGTADSNNDGSVNIYDLLNCNDANLDGNINGLDFLIAQRQYDAYSTPLTTIPEPSTILVLFGALAPLSVGSRFKSIRRACEIVGREQRRQSNPARSSPPRPMPRCGLSDQALSLWRWPCLEGRGVSD